MSRYIDADNLTERFTKAENYEPNNKWTFDAILYGIKTEPTVDVAPVTHAHWIDVPQGYLKCSECGKGYLLMSAINYCPFCGAKMDEGKNE